MYIKIFAAFIGTILVFQSNLISQDNRFLIYSADKETEQEYINHIWDYGFEEDGEAYVALQRIIEQPIIDKNYQQAIQKIEEYRVDMAESYHPKLDELTVLLKVPLENLKSSNFGDYINSQGSEYSPMPSADGKKLYFTGIDRTPENTSEDIFVSELRGGQWSAANRITGSLNTPTKNEAPQAISVDGNTIVLFGAFEKNYFGKGDIYYSDRTLLGWGEPQHFPAPINSEHYDVDAKYTADRKHLIFTSDRPGGIGEYKPRGEYFNGSLHGNTDIYVASFADDGSVDTVVNLGNVINTPFAERKPFLHPDGKTLYFSSDGHAGIGRLDLFVSKRLSEDSWTEWSKPINMGKEINSPFDESGAVVTTFGDLAYFASQERDINYGKSDIYSIEIPDALKPEPVAGISGNVEDINGFPLGAKIIWEDLETGETIGEAISDPSTGEFYLVLELGKNYGIIAEKEGYFPISNNINLKDADKSKQIDLKLEMQSIDELFGDDLETTGTNSLIYDAFNLKRPTTIRMNNLFFAYNESTILKESHSELDRAAYLLNNYPIKKVNIEGHTDSIGGASYNKKLSEERAKSVVIYLAEKGVPKTMMSAVGYGMERPVAPNDTDENRQKNRRVELQIEKGTLPGKN
jgi:outer membrane protein OmpA-like peptidoglycan-associated protein